MAKKSIQTPALPPAPKKKTALETSYWSALNDTLAREDSELLLRQEVHGIRRAGIRKRIY